MVALLLDIDIEWHLIWPVVLILLLYFLRNLLFELVFRIAG